jgi:precorrin-2 dehydrogenase/sirohydrochlorin ferrochelatase
MRAAYPMMLDVTDRLVVIIGGGRVAARKARVLLEAGARRVRMVAPEFAEEVPPGVERVVGRYEATHVEGAGLVFAATDSAEVNEAVVAEAGRRGILVNRADGDEKEPGDFATPAVLRKGPVTVTVSTAGAPALAVMIRDELAARFEPRWREMAEAMLKIRPAILAVRMMSGERRRAAFGDLVSREAMEALSAGGAEAVWRWLVERYPELA